MAKKILLVDDEEDFLKLMRVRLESWGYNVLTAENGKEGVEAVSGQGPDIVILDYMMPEMDGIETLKKMRRINKDIPVVMFTAYPNKPVMGSVEKLGISAFIPKLSGYADILPLLKTALEMIEKGWKKKG